MKRFNWQWLSAAGLAAVLVGGPLAQAADEQPANRPRRGGPPAVGERGPAGERGPGMRAGSEEWFNRWGAELKLTDAQKEKIRALQKEQSEKGDKIRQDTSLTPEQRREKMRALREENDKKMKEILTAEQYQKWQELRQTRAGAPNRDPGQGRGQGQRPGRGPRTNTQ